MPVRGTVLKSSNTSLFEVYVAKPVAYDITGAIHHPASGSFWNFDSILDMVNVFENYLDESDFPQNTSVQRSFDKRLAGAQKKLGRLRGLLNVSGVNTMEKPTFIVRVQYRQNATWQGSIQWVEAKKTQQFRSVLEMIRLMEQVVDASEEDQDISWNEE